MKVDFTRDDAIRYKCSGIAYPEAFIQALEALGLIEFNPDVKKLYEMKDTTWGTIRIEQWSEGLILWVGGEIVWKSFK